VTKALADQYSFVHFVRRPEHSGMFDNLADVTQHASGEYIWWFGDDDQLLPGGLQMVMDHLTDTDMAFVAVGNSFFTPHSDKVLEGNLLDLCNHMGWNQVIGWITGDLLRCDIAQQVCHLLRQEPYKLDAYAHVGAVLTVAGPLKARLLDHAIVQPGQQDQEDINRWAQENVGWRYFLLIETFKHLFDQHVFTQKFSPKFFKYLNIYLWDRFIAGMISSNLSADPYPDKGWDIIMLMAEMVDDPDVRKGVVTRCQSARFLCNQRKSFIQQVNNTNEILEFLAAETNIQVLPLGVAASLAP
jgi:hypothetical protein